MIDKNKEDMFWPRVIKGKPDECWEWIGYKKKSGYGRFWVNGRGIAAHRFSYELHNGPINERCVKQTCGNRSCVNPAHLVLNETTIFKTDEERFLGRVNKSGDCWEWTGTTTAYGYGLLSIKNKQHYAHRIAYEFSKGPIPKGLHIMHHCDNPACVNPDHLSAVTAKENIRDSVKKNRFPKGETNGHCRLSDNQIIEIRFKRKEGASYNDLAKKYQVGARYISKITRMKSRKSPTYENNWEQ